MSVSKVSNSRRRQMLEKEIKNKRKSLEAYKTFINPKYDENISVLEAKKFQKEVELKKCYVMQCTAVFLNSLCHQ